VRSFDPALVIASLAIACPSCGERSTGGPSGAGGSLNSTVLSLDSAAATAFASQDPAAAEGGFPNPIYVSLLPLANVPNACAFVDSFDGNPATDREVHAASYE
jgi:hypothetical protein